MTMLIPMKNADHGMTQHLFLNLLTARKMMHVSVNLGTGIIPLISDES
jgi:hypothetical protein